MLVKTLLGARMGQGSGWILTRMGSTAASSNAASTTPTAAFESRVAKGLLTADPHQARVVEQFQDLHDRLRGYSGPAAAGAASPLASPLAALKGVLFGDGGPVGGGPAAGVPQGVYLWGTVGGGKTMLMDLFYDTVEADGDRKSRVHYHDFMQTVHSLLHEAKKSAPPRDVSMWDTYQPFDPIPPVGDSILEENYLICLDEFQVTDIADAMILKQLFSYLFDRGLVLVATSNRPPDDLYKKGLQRSNFLPFIDLLKERCRIVSLDPGVDYRRKAMAGAEKLYFLTGPGSDDNAEGSMKAMFKFLSSMETDTVRPRTLRIKGRDLSFAKTCGGVLYSDFHELCGRALWTNDYLKLTQVFHTVFIRDIPVITRKLRSEARRFITLIDTLYDHRVRVVASGAAPYWELFQQEEQSEQERLEEHRMLVDDLGIKAAEGGSLDASVFSGEEELFAFDRTVSRMTEMQTKDYWKKWKTHMSHRSMTSPPA